MAKRNSDGEILTGVGSCAQWMGQSQKATQSRVDRNLIPYRKWGGRIIFIKSELIAFLAALEGCTVDQALQNLAQRNSKSDDTTRLKAV